LNKYIFLLATLKRQITKDITEITGGEKETSKAKKTPKKTG